MPTELPLTIPEQTRLEKKEILGVALLFLVFRMMVPLWFVPQYSEFAHYLYPFMLLSDPGFISNHNLQPALPFIDYWLEYPPVFPWVALAVYHVNVGIFGTGGGGPLAFSASVSMFLAVVDLANLLLIYMIAKKVDGHRFAMRCTVGYSLLFFPLVLAAGYFDSIVLCAMLLSLWAMIQGKPALAGGAVGFGIMTKFIPFMLIPVAVKYLVRKPEPGDPLKKDWSRLINYFGAMLLTMGVLGSTFFFVKRDLLVMPFRVTLERPGWETLRAVWAGRYGVGHVGPDESLHKSDSYCASLESPYRMAIQDEKLLEDLPQRFREPFRLRIASRFNPDFRVAESTDNLRVPLFIVIGALYLLMFLFAPPEPTPLNYAGFACITVCTGFVYSSGWSPQFIIYLLPLALLSLWPRINVFFAVALSIINFLEMPVWLFHLRGPGHEAREFLVVVVVLRTIFLCIIGGLAFYHIGSKAKKPEMSY